MNLGETNTQPITKAFQFSVRVRVGESLLECRLLLLHSQGPAPQPPVASFKIQGGGGRGRGGVPAGKRTVPLTPIGKAGALKNAARSGRVVCPQEAPPS